MIATAPRNGRIASQSDPSGAADADPIGFGALLKRYRLETGLSQEALAERAGLSMCAVSALERGARSAPYRATVAALAAALGLASSERASLEAAITRSRGPRPAATAAQVGAPTPLPHPPTALVDRVEELATAQELLRSDAVRLLTLTGPAGVGKTRLALQLASDLRATFPDGVWFVDLAPIRDPDLVLGAIAHALDVQARERQALPDALRAALGERQVLVVLDNFEQVLVAALQLATLLATCPGLKLLVTSRARLRLRWEHTLPLTPLPVPEGEGPQTLETLATVPAVALFVDRARAANPAFALTARNAAAVAALCRQLDGLPLALELVAARANVLDPVDMLSWVGRCLPALEWDAADLPARHQSLRTAMDGSYGLLAAAEQALFRRLAVFTGGWTRAAATAVAALGDEELDTIEGLGSLVDASLVQVSPEIADGPRFRLLETVREYALEQLDASAEREAAERAHAAYFLALAEQAERHLKGPEQVAWYHRLQGEQDNLRAALAWAAAHDEPEVELRLVGCLTYFWWAGGDLHEAGQWLEDALARSAGRRDGLRCKVLVAAGLVAAYVQDFAGASALLEEARVLALELGDPRGAVEALSRLAIASWLEGRLERLPMLAAELAALRAEGDPWDVGVALNGLGMLAHGTGDLPGAKAYLDDALALYRQAGDGHRAASVLGMLAVVVYEQGDSQHAAMIVAEALQLGPALGELRAAVSCIRAAVQVSSKRAPAATLARLLGALDVLFARLSFPLSPRQQAGHDQAVATVRAALGDEAFAAAQAAGRSLTLDDARAEALAALQQPAAGEPAPASKAQPEYLLSPREQEVLSLVAAGLTNKQIAERLVIAEGTSKFHVSSLLNKLGADNRTQAVARAYQPSPL